MAKYVVFYDIKLNGEIDECVGGDSYVKPDQRYSIETIIHKVKNKEIFRPIHAIGFKIHVGTILNNKPITNLIKF